MKELRESLSAHKILPNTEPFLEKELLFGQRGTPRSYPGCPYCKKRRDVAVGREVSCETLMCQGRKVGVVTLWKSNYFAGDRDGGCFVIDFVPFCHEPSLPNPVCWVMKILGINRKERKWWHGAFPSAVVLASEPRYNVWDDGDMPTSTSTLPSLSRALKDLYDKQQTEWKRLGLGFELLGVAARQEVRRHHPDFGFRWDGVVSYLGNDSDSNDDFADSFRGTGRTDQYKNSNGAYSPSAKIKHPTADHYTFAKVQSVEEEAKWAKASGKGLVITGQQVTTFPFETDGRVRECYVESFLKLRDSIVREVIEPHLTQGGVGGIFYSSTKHVTTEPGITLKDIIRFQPRSAISREDCH